MAWQTQVLLALMFLGGGYLLWVNKMPPFNKGGIFEDLNKLLPVGDGGQEIFGGDGEDEGDSGGIGREQGTPMGIPPQTGNPNLPPTMGGSPPSGAQPPGIGQGPMPLPPFQTALQSDPTQTDYTAYKNYAAALNFTYGQGNQANLGPTGGFGAPQVVGDPNLGTTPVPTSLFQAPMGPYGMQPGMGGMPPPGMYPGGQPTPFGPYPGGQVPFAQGGGALGPTTIPPYGFLPNPLQYPGGIQPGPYPASPPPQQLPIGVGGAVGLVPGAIVFTPGGISYKRRHDGYMPVLHSIEDLYKVDIGKVMGGDFPSIRIGDLVNMGYPLRAVFPNGVDYNQDEKTQDAIERWVDRMYSRMGNISPTMRAQSLFDLLRSPALLQYV